jgi:transcriptional regulator with XRE-family HTH domain
MRSRDKPIVRLRTHCNHDTASLCIYKKKFHIYDQKDEIFMRQYVSTATSRQQSSSTTSPEETDLLVGGRIRNLRKARGLSLKEVALRAGLSGSFLSQLERGISSASVRHLARLAEALDVGLAEIFPVADGETGGPTLVARVADRKKITFGDFGMSKELLTPFDKSPRLDIYIISMEPGGTTGDKPYVHQGEEAGYVLEGGIELVVDGQKSILNEGDSFRFSSTNPHQYRNAGTRPAKAVWINYREK